jgi:hypothetical protein
MSDPGVPYQGDYDIEDDEDDFEEAADADCMLMEDGQCMAAGSEWCDFECPNRMSEMFAGSPAWMRAHGSACEKCHKEFADGEEPDKPRACVNCGGAGAVVETENL